MGGQGVGGSFAAAGLPLTLLEVTSLEATLLEVMEIDIKDDKIFLNGKELGPEDKAEARKIQYRLNKLYGLPKYSSYPDRFDILETGNEKNS